MKILFKVYPQDSHYNATFPLARKLRAAGCEVIYAGDDDRRAPVEAQGFRFHAQKEDLLPKMVAGSPSQAAPGMFTIAREMIASWRQRAATGIMRIPSDGFDELVQEVKPDAILVDSPYARFSLALFKHRIPFGILESMVRLDYRPGVPPPSEEVVPDGGLLCRVICDALWFKYWATTRLFQLVGWHVVPSKQIVADVLRATGSEHVKIDFRRYFHIGVSSVPEFILSPKEFEFPSPTKPNQNYVGPSVDLERTETGYDYLYHRRMEPFLRARAEKTPLVYCSLGTASWRYAGIQDFFRRVIEASAGQPWNLVIAMGNELEPRFYHPLPANVLIFQKVPQIHALKHADLAITHGGMNTVAECILLKVPMLVLPGTKELDQPGNAGRVVYHRIGLKGSLRRDSAPLLRAKINILLTEPGYRSRISAMSESIVNSRAYNHGAEIVLDLLSRAHVPA
jgi:zeaxanthin glucosyltransferase